MSRVLTASEIKDQIRLLVKACGGVDACGVELGVKHQRVSLFQNVDEPDMPSFRQILQLEAMCGQAIVTGAAMRAIEGAPAEALTAAAVDSVQSSAAVLGAVHAMEADGRRTRGEIRAVQAAAQAHLREAQETADAAMRLTPGGVQ